MSEENNNSDWTKDSLYKHFITLREEDKGHEKETRANLKEFLCDKVEATKDSINHLKELIANALTSSDKALAKAEASDAAKFAGLNELRGVVTDQQQLFSLKSEQKIINDNFDDKLNILEKRIDKIENTKEAVTETKKETKFNITQVLGWITAVLLIVGFIITYFISRGV
jgi:uncharacterized protein with von Willebrand factor type A (vWA) domain